VHGGYGWGTSDWNFPPHSPTAGGAWSPFRTGGAFSQNPSGGILGGHVGYNVQVGNWVFGPEASIAWNGLKSTSTDPLAASLGAIGTTYETRLNWLAKTTARLGYAPANWLIYAKGGLAAAQGESTMTFVATPPAFSFHERNAYVGWTIGAGFEYALSTNWVAGLEYDYVNLGKEHYGGNIPLGGGLVASQTDYEVGVKFSTILARVSYKFGAPAVVAKY
jgi:outer membrane immunogenic protein